MPRYEFRCRVCASAGGPPTFEVERPMRASGDPAQCPLGHADTVKLLSTISLGGRSGGPGSGAGAAASAPAMTPAGGCCGGGCCGG